MPAAARRLAWRYRRARRQLPNVVRRAVLAARQPTPNGSAPAAPEAEAAPEAGPDQAALVRSLARGNSVEQAVITQVRALLADEAYDVVQSLAESLRRRPETETLGHLAGGMAAFRRGYAELAWDHLRRVPRDAWASSAAAEYTRSGLAVAPDETLAEIRRLVDDDPPHVRARRWFEILTPVYGFGAEELARDLFAIFDRRVSEGRSGWPQAEVHRDWLRPWIAASANSPTAPPPVDGRPAFAIMDYGHPSARKASANIGDHIQTIAALGHLVRHQNVRLHGREDLVDLLRQLQGRTRPELQRTDVDADLEVLTVHRDASMYEAIPENTWVLCFGWFMHALFKMRHGFPLHDNLRPIFVSFHCNKRELLTPEAVEYLKRYGPVGCRDWTTVYLLLSLGVPAFFSGCLTTTINTVFPDLTAGPGRDAPVAYVDAPGDVPEDAVTYRHSDGEVRRRSFVANVYEGLELLETYRRKHSGIVTSRLHCYLPTRSIGMDVDFRPKNRADVRFDGLIDISDAEFDQIRDGLRRQARPGLHGDPERAAAGRGLRPVAGDHRRRRGVRGGAPPAADPPPSAWPPTSTGRSPRPSPPPSGRSRTPPTRCTWPSSSRAAAESASRRSSRRCSSTPRARSTSRCSRCPARARCDGASASASRRSPGAGCRSAGSRPTCAPRRGPRRAREPWPGS